MEKPEYYLKYIFEYYKVLKMLILLSFLQLLSINFRHSKNDQQK